jgi:hypothetical protein
MRKTKSTRKVEIAATKKNKKSLSDFLRPALANTQTPDCSNTNVSLFAGPN